MWLWCFDLLHQRLGRAVDHAAHGARLDRLHGGALDVLDLAQEVFELGIGLAVDGHAAEVADIAVIVAAGIEREDVAFLPFLLRRRAIEARSRGDQAIIEGEPAACFLAPQRFASIRAWSRPVRAWRSPPAWNRSRLRTRCAAARARPGSSPRAAARARKRRRPSRCRETPCAAHCLHRRAGTESSAPILAVFMPARRM